ncbi:unnamed protein product [Auanema sp. JU1783]|nr:unnamed protein product [Auanema sp. JU1783]
MRSPVSFFLIFICFQFALSWGWNNYGNYGQPLPNNNVGIGYPTAYGLWTGRGQNNGGWDGYNNGNTHPAQGTGFGSPLRCLNGGAHIGQCRLDKDSICIALGGTCIHGACCTTPFVGLLTTTTQAPLIDGDVTIASVPSRRTKRPEESIEKEKRPIIDSVDPIEIEEFNRVIQSAKTTPSPIIETTESSTEDDYESETEAPLKLCSSGLRAVGPCADDDDCPSLHMCEANQCCYIV